MNIDMEIMNKEKGPVEDMKENGSGLKCVKDNSNDNEDDDRDEELHW